MRGHQRIAPDLPRSRGTPALLPRFARRLIVPLAVAEELRRRGSSDPAVRAFAAGSGIEVGRDVPVPPGVAAWGLGSGESAVLALAKSIPGAIAVLDDLAGRRCAAALGLPVRGTLGIVLVAKQRGWIPNARQVLEDLICGGMYLSRAVLDAALRRVGE